MSVLILGLLGLLVWWWLASLHAREAALEACLRACKQERVQLLDETVRLRRLGLARDSSGRIKVRRAYVFEYSLEGDDRRMGEVICLGRNPELVRAEWPNQDDRPETMNISETARVMPFRGKDGTPRH